ncbi:similar to Saccharomyces cerevisiae YHR028C DAP2 Dipeptidyl aminopeptidase, synthesized as a glycosylated precursor [Maudiozyma saulgeensis]|uniref:Similar to Saccharomyces cerevisiae YHR028C DAP2 Dipeptidyl aminopeptidase, synthesized as a glycosylated n=1 Tax=Maudiozyma saulgeensis TaxID=1789683 RepID=A0A1X7R573_9SACH|nr:similar to Saccharomyces cerevisiae YHR028C DAP2 Dipeptidyl aminopeptidase, synthesized as a glycosylated precursor [Kazachstania saulgeensis]
MTSKIHNDNDNATERTPLDDRQNEVEDIERIPQDRFKSDSRQLVDRLIKLGVVVLLLVWGSLLLVKTLKSNNTEPESVPQYSFPNPNVTVDGKLKVSFPNVRNGTFKPKMHNIQWLIHSTDISDDKGLYVTWQDDSYVIKSVSDKHFEKVLLKGKTFVQDGHNMTIDNIVASPDLKKLLVKTNTIKNWRHSTIASYFVYDKSSQTFSHIGDHITLAEWSPNAIDIAYIQDNDIFLYSTERGKTTEQITSDGSSQIFNGRPDWVYEEEVFESDKALWWSPDGSYIAFLKIDETDVKEFTIPYYVQEENSIYPEMRSIKYPKSGQSNPLVDLYVYSTSDKVSFPGHTSKYFQDSDNLITEVIWVGRDNVIAKVSDRSQDLLKILEVDANKRTTEVTRIESSQGGWWEVTHNTIHIPSNQKFNRPENGYIDILPINGFNHLVYFSPINSTKPLILTKGNWEVVNGAAAFDYDTNRVYFISTKKSSMERHLYYVKIDRPGIVHKVTDTSEDGVFSATFSSSARFMLLTCSGPDVPYQKIVDLRSTKKDKHIRGNVLGETLYYLEKNEELSEMTELYKLPTKKFNELNLGKDANGDDIIVNSFEILPNDFNRNLKNHYPVFFYAYGGPNSQQVVKTFGVGFNEIVASQLGAIIVVVDGRGTGFKGRAFRSLVRDNLGDYEAQDQIAAAAYYGSKSYVDSEKISLFGWSYGGYLTLKTLERDGGEHFKYGMSVAPVTDWRLYDSVYTERYMHTPQENEEGYDNSKVNNVTSIGQAQRFLLMHGTGDDNVHFQNSLKFLDELNLNNIENYDVHVFPDSDHSISYHNANKIVYDKLFNWIKHAYLGVYLL